MSLSPGKCFIQTIFCFLEEKKTLKIKTPSFALNKRLSKIPDPPNAFLNIHQHKYEV